VTTRERHHDRGNRIARRALVAIGEDVREARLGAGLSQAAVGATARTSHTTVGRIERGLEPGASVALLCRVCAAVGLDLTVRLYPGGDPIRDRGHVRLLARLRSRLGPGLQWRTEVVLPDPRDPRAWDATISRAGVVVAVEAETRLHDLQALDRRIAMKRRDGNMGVVILLVADTAANRRALAVGREHLRASFPIDGRIALPRLARGEPPEAGALILL